MIAFRNVSVADEVVLDIKSSTFVRTSFSFVSDIFSNIEVNPSILLVILSTFQLFTSPEPNSCLLPESAFPEPNSGLSPVPCRLCHGNCLSPDRIIFPDPNLNPEPKCFLSPDSNSGLFPDPRYNHV